MTDRILNHLIKIKMVETKDKEIYRYGLECLFLKLLYYVSYLVIAFLFNEIAGFLLFMLTFVAIRKNAGGGHAKTKTGCYSISSLMIIIVLFLLRNSWKMNINFWLLMIFFADCIVWLFAPCESRNRNLEKTEQNDFGKRSKIILCGLNVIMFVAIWINKAALVAVGCAVICEAVLLIMGKMQLMKNK